MIKWVLTIVFLVSATWSLTEFLRLTCPAMTAKQRWEAVFWLLATAGAIDLAWRVGA